MTQSEALYYGTSIIIATFMSGTGFIHFIFASYHSDTKVRVAISSLIYRKVFTRMNTTCSVHIFTICFAIVSQSLRLSQRSLSNTSPGKLVNLLSNDINRFSHLIVFFHRFWVSLLTTIAGAYILWREVRWAGLIGIATICLLMITQSMLSTHS